MKEYSVFISYSRKDDTNFLNDTGKLSPIDKILKRFEKEGIKPWIDREGKYCGAMFQEQILEALDNSELVLFISSVNSNNDQSRWVFSEVNIAYEKGMQILPLMLDDTPFNKKIGLVFGGIDRNEYYKNPTKALNDLVGSIKRYIDEIKRREKEEIKAKEAERRRIEEEKEKRLKEEEEKKRIEKLEKEITNIKKRIIDCVEKQQSYMKDWLLKEKELNKSNENYKECPVCQTQNSNIDLEYCDFCGWHFATPKELFISDMKRLYEDRLHISKTNWKEKQERKEELIFLKKEKETLTTKLNESQKELYDYKNKYNIYLEDSKKQIKSNVEEITKLTKELNNSKSQFVKVQQKVTELSKKLVSNSSSKGKQPIAFLLVTEFDQTNVYCLYEGQNLFGAMQKNSNQPEYQMLVVSENSLNPLHFEINIKRNEKRFVYSISPINNSCVLALNSHSNTIKSENNIQIYDLLFIGNVKIQIIDNFNKIF